MEIILISIAVMFAVLLVIWIAVSAIVFVWQEMNHNIKNFKRAVREFMWDLEWKFGKRG